MMKKKLIGILYELYQLHRSIGSNSSYGFFNAIQTLKEVDNTYIKSNAVNLSIEPFKLYRIGSHIQEIINDYISNKYTRLFNDRLKVYDLGKLDKKYYDISNNVISKRLPIQLIKRYLKLLGIKYLSIKFGKGHKSDLNHLKYGVGSVTILIHKSYLDKYKSNLSKDYSIIKDRSNNVRLLRNDETQFIINIKVK